MITLRTCKRLGGMVLLLSTGLVHGQSTTGGNVYNEPTRGFLLERGNIYETKKISVDVASGSAASSNSLTGEARIGLPGSELQFRGSGGAGQAALKWGLPGVETIDWAVLGGLGYRDLEDAGKVTDLRFGLPITWNLLEERLLLSVVPEVMFYDIDLDSGADDDGTAWSLGFGGYYNVADTDYGKVQVGGEYIFNRGDDDNLKDDFDVDFCPDDNTFSLGVRWMYNERVNMDFIFYQNRCDKNDTSVPGFARINIVF